MSHRFPPIAAPTPQTAVRVRVLTLPSVSSLPWMELALGLAFLFLLRGI